MKRLKGKLLKNLSVATGDREGEARGKVEERLGQEPTGSQLRSATRAVRASHHDFGETDAHDDGQAPTIDELPNSSFAFPARRMQPLRTPADVRAAVEGFSQLSDVSERERDRAWRRIRAAARSFGVPIETRGWRQLQRRH